MIECGSVQSAGPSNTLFILWKDGAILLEHEACQEQPLNILDTFGKRNPAMGTPNLCGYYFRMTDLFASQLFQLTLSRLTPPSEAATWQQPGVHLHRHPEAVRGWIWQCAGGAFTQNQIHEKDI